MRASGDRSPKGAPQARHCHQQTLGIQRQDNLGDEEEEGKDGRKDNLEDYYDEENEERGNIFEEEKAFRGRTTLVMRRKRRRMGGEGQPQE